jgi:hypothetical protein
MARMTEIYVALLNEGTGVWRPVPAIAVAENVYRLTPKAPPSDDEEWEFAPGESVRCEFRVLSGGAPVLVAVERVMAAI